MSNVLDVKLPRKRIRVPLLFAISFLYFFPTATALILGYGGGGIIAYELFFLSHAERSFLTSGQDFFETYIVPFLCIPCAIIGTIMLRWLLARILPNPVKIIAVEIDRIIPVWPEATVYHFRGGSIEELAITPPRRDENLFFRFDKKGTPHLDRRRYNFSRFKKGHRLLYLDKSRNIAMAIEKQRSGGAALLDEDLSYVRLNKREKQQFLAALKAEQAALARDPWRLNCIIEAIPDNPLIFGWLSRLFKKLF